ncbi:hypothetical protein ScalyP_jg10967 [Parmales sp. scaly parma]|nr:hypothetical protein ScalyP_jg10967 [Parmales sp. scaly parma]
MGTVDKRKLRVQAIADREQERARKSRLESLLVQKLCTKYGTPQKSRTNQTIKTTVKSFMQSAIHISEKDLQSMETEVQRAIEDARMAPSSSVSQLPSSSSRSRHNPTSSSSKPSSKRIPMVLDPDDPKTNPWTVMDTLKAIEAEESLKNDKIKLHADRKAMAASLDSQMSVFTVREKQVKKENDNYLSAQQSMLNEWKREQKFADVIIHDKNLQMRRIRQSQIDEKHARKLAEKQQQRDADIKAIAICQRELQREKDDLGKSKVKAFQAMEKIKLENIEKERLREIQRQKDDDWEKQLAKEYIAKVDREQKAREDALSQRMERYEEIGQQWADAGAGKAQKEAMIKLEQKILREAQAKDQADIDRENRDKRMLEENKRMMMKTNTKMAEDKFRREKAQSDKDFIYASRFRREGESYGAEEEVRKNKDKQKAKAHCELLKAQIEEQRIMQKRVDMNQTEMSLNKDQMDRILYDPVTGDKLMKKLNEKHTMKQSVAFKYKSSIPGLSRVEGE